MESTLRISREPDEFSISSDAEMIFYSARTTWWTDDQRYLGRLPSELPGYSGLPCDPRGSVLFQTEKVGEFLQAAYGNATNYGRHGLRAFMAAKHGVIVGPTGYYSAAITWEEVNMLLDKWDTIVRVNGNDPLE